MTRFSSGHFPERFTGFENVRKYYDTLLAPSGLKLFDREIVFEKRPAVGAIDMVWATIHNS